MDIMSSFLFMYFKSVLSVQAPFVASRSVYIQRWKLRDVLFTAKIASVWGENQSVNQQYTDTAITAMVIKSQGLHQLKNRQRETSRRAEPIFVSTLQCEGGQHSEQILHTILWEHKAPLWAWATEKCVDQLLSVLGHGYLFIFWKQCSWWWLYWF